jgi:phosphodiesterase/alkaline phosphatase D-like protein
MLSRVTLGALVAASVAEASFDRNLAYSSPSRRHPSLAVPLAHVSKRQTGGVFAPAEVNFTHGVASGDPYDTSVILWTRLSPTVDSVASDLVPEGVVPIYDDAEGAQPSSKAACVEFKIATDQSLANVVDQGRAYTTSDVDYTVKVSIQLHMKNDNMLTRPSSRQAACNLSQRTTTSSTSATQPKSAHSAGPRPSPPERKRSTATST